VLSGSELWLLRLMADRGLALLDASALLMVVEEGRELRVDLEPDDNFPVAHQVYPRGACVCQSVAC